MKITIRKWQAAALGLLCWAIVANAQTRFVQITDPHIFDSDQVRKGESLSKSQRQVRTLDTERAFINAVNFINRLVVQGAHFEFIVITGDLGLAHISYPPAQAAKRMKSWLAACKVMRFLFVPGNNDIGNSMEYIEKYREFIAALKKQMPNRVYEICSEPIEYTQGTLYIGHNSASYKYQHDKQLVELQALRSLIASKTASRIYLFSHIAGIDDPYLVYTNRPDSNQEYPFSAWGVSSQVRKLWYELLADPRVKAVFTGHFHIYQRSYYQKPFNWIRDNRYPQTVLDKTYLCPPISAKYQWEQSQRARGFQIVTLDQQGDVSTQVYWYERGRFAVARPTADN
ncbi:MAG: metallophosphoesterase [Acidobacteriota bacterium]